MGVKHTATLTVVENGISGWHPMRWFDPVSHSYVMVSGPAVVGAGAGSSTINGFSISPGFLSAVKSPEEPVFTHPYSNPAALGYAAVDAHSTSSLSFDVLTNELGASIIRGGVDTLDLNEDRLRDLNIYPRIKPDYLLSGFLGDLTSRDGSPYQAAFAAGHAYGAVSAGEESSTWYVVGFEGGDFLDAGQWLVDVGRADGTSPFFLDIIDWSTMIGIPHQHWGQGLHYHFRTRADYSAALSAGLPLGEYQQFSNTHLVGQVPYGFNIGNLNGLFGAQGDGATHVTSFLDYTGDNQNPVDRRGSRVNIRAATQLAADMGSERNQSYVDNLFHDVTQKTGLPTRFLAPIRDYDSLNMMGSENFSHYLAVDGRANLVMTNGAGGTWIMGNLGVINGSMPQAMAAWFDADGGLNAYILIQSTLYRFHDPKPFVDLNPPIIIADRYVDRSAPEDTMIAEELRRVNFW